MPRLERSSQGSHSGWPLWRPARRRRRTAAHFVYRHSVCHRRLQTETGEAFGSVVNVLNFGGGDILVIARADGDETLFLPFTKAVFPQGDIGAGHLTVVPPAGIEAKPPER
ncbi:MAG: PRC-barrel domain-containing protein [Methylocella sp.]